MKIVKKVCAFRGALVLLVASMAALALSEGEQVQDEKDARPEQVVYGEALYREHCAACHGVSEEGEVRTAAALVGEHNPLRVYGNAQILYNYVSLTMPFDKPGALEPEEYWAVLAFMLDVHGLLPEGLELSAENAEGVALRREE